VKPGELGMKAALVIWMLANPTLYFLLAASPERGGLFGMLPLFVQQLHDWLIGFFTRAAVY